MKFKSFYMFAALSIIMSACSKSEDENGGGNNSIPNGALPSPEFTLNNLPKEPYADDAVRIVAETAETDLPFYSLELLPDGTYLMSTLPYDYYSAPIQVKTKADGTFTVRNPRKTRRLASRTDENGTISFWGGEYGKFEKISEKKYRLSGGAEIDLSGLGSKIVLYTNNNGLVSQVYVNEYAPILNNATQSLCRTWNVNSIEMWAYWNNIYYATAKQTINNGSANTTYDVMSGMDFSPYDFFDYDDEACYKVIFTDRGTYICFYFDGEIDFRDWKWMDSSQGTLHWYDEDDDKDDGYVTVRFAGKQMRVYEDYNETEDGMSGRIIFVNTLTAAH